MATPDLTAIAAAAKATMDAAAVTVDGSDLKVYATEPGPHGLDSLPAAWVRFDSFERAGPDEPEDQLGSYLWRLTYEVVLVVRADDAVKAQRDMNTVLADVIDAFDADPTIGGTVLIDSRLESGEQAWTDTPDKRQLLLMTCRLAVMTLSS